MRVKLGVTLVVVPFAAVLGSSDARAGNAIAAGACVPSIGTLEELKYQVVNGAYEFADGEVGTLYFTCPVPVPNSVGADGYSGWMWTDNDDDGFATTGYHVTAELKRINKTTGAVDTQCTLVSQSSTMGSRLCTNQLGQPLELFIDHIGYFHFVRVTMHRSVVQPAGQSVRFHAMEWTPYPY